MEKKRRRLLAGLIMCSVLLGGCSGETTKAAKQDVSGTEARSDAFSQTEAAESAEKEQEKDVFDEPYVLVRESIDKKNAVVYEYAYDEKGDKISETVSYPKAPDETLYREYITEYQADGSKIVSESQTILQATGEAISQETFEYEYNAEGFLIRKTGFRDGEKQGEILFEYDEKGNQISQSEGKAGSGATSLAKQYEYDDAGNRIKEIWFGLDGAQNRSYTYAYDEDGKEIERRTFNASGEELTDERMQSQWRYEYDEEGRITEEWKEGLDAGHTREHYQYEYDEYGNVCKKKDLTQKITYEYLPLSVYLAGT